MGKEQVPFMADEKKKRRRRFGDRSDGYKLRTINPMNKFMPYIMPMRCDACNTYADMFDISKTDRFCRQKVKEGKTSFGFLHIMIAAYLRAISQRPGINRFVSGQKIYARNDIQIVMTIKKTLSLDSPDTCIKVRFNADDTVDEVYEKFNAVVSEIQNQPDDKTSFDKLNKILSLIPGLLCRWTVKLLYFLDYFGLLPKNAVNRVYFRNCRKILCNSVKPLLNKPHLIIPASKAQRFPRIRFDIRQNRCGFYVYVVSVIIL